MQKPSKKNLLLHKRLPWKGTPALEILKLFAGSSEGVLWENSSHSYLGFSPRKIVKIREGSAAVSIRERGQHSLKLETPLPLLEELREEARPRNGGEDPSLPPFKCGLVGIIGYEALKYCEKIPAAPFHEEQEEFCFFLLDRVIAIDKEKLELHVFVLQEGERSEKTELEEILRRIDSLEKSRDRVQEREEKPCPALHYSQAYSEEEFTDKVVRAKEYIRAGDAFQIVLSNKFSIKKRCDPFSVYQHLQRGNPSPFHYLIKGPKTSLVGASPELMLRSQGNKTETKVEMRLVAGTYPKRSATGSVAEDSQQILIDEKELAEHHMLVDHVRNDLGKVSRIGSVEVEELLAVETYADVLHLVSQVSGTLADPQAVLEALLSCFPIATMTGTPKVRAMEIIAELEQRARGYYSGAVVVMDSSGWLESSVVIRSVFVGEHSAEVSAGAGIVFDSRPEREYQECFWKAKAGLRAIAASDQR